MILIVLINEDKRLSTRQDRIASSGVDEALSPSSCRCKNRLSKQGTPVGRQVGVMCVFRWRHFAGEIILWAVRWYCRYGISYRELEDGAVVANFYSNELGGAFDIKNKYGKEMLGFSIFNPGVPYFRLSNRDGYNFFTLGIYVDDDIASNPFLRLGSSKTKRDALVARADENGGRLFLNCKSGQRRIDVRMYTNADTPHLDLYDENGYAFFSTGTYTGNDPFLPFCV